jgi:lipopolysaccharide/colanic/teichoic acid biosynthesis glycosyltransferase
MEDSIEPSLSAFEGPTKGGSLSEFGLAPFKTVPVRAATRRIVSAPQQSRTRVDDLSSDSPKIADKDHSPTVQTVSSKPVWKRILDIACVLLTLPLWLPLMVFICVWIKVVSRGPVFFRQTRIGLGGKTFTMLKFRSMKAGAETRTHENHFKELVQSGVPMVKLDSLKDRRIIPGGRLLRCTGLDELPQLFNVLLGDMSLVGPRPCTPSEMECYSEPQRARFEVLPGITGYWQVNGKNKTTFNQMVEMDIQYRERMSLMFDLVIMMGTLPALAMQALESRWKVGGSRPATPAPGENEKA